MDDKKRVLIFRYFILAGQASSAKRNDNLILTYENKLQMNKTVIKIACY